MCACLVDDALVVDGLTDGSVSRVKKGSARIEGLMVHECCWVSMSRERATKTGDLEGSTTESKRGIEACSKDGWTVTDIDVDKVVTRLLERGRGRSSRRWGRWR